MKSVTSSKSGLQSGCLLLLVVISVMLAFLTNWPWPFVVFACLMCVSLFVQVGWVIPFTLTGFYLAIFVGVPDRTRGHHSENFEFVAWIVAGTLSGLLVGVLIDKHRGNASRRERAGRTGNCVEPRGAQEASADMQRRMCEFIRLLPDADKDEHIAEL